MKHLAQLLAAVMILLGVASNAQAKNAEVVPGAARTDTYVPLLNGKRIAILSNMTGMVGKKHTLDVMLDNGLNVTTIFSPEHGFRGTADAGEKVSSSIDPATATSYSGASSQKYFNAGNPFGIVLYFIKKY